MSHLTLSLPLCGFLGFAGLVLALMALANRVARRSLGGEQPLPMTVSRTYTQSSGPVAAPLPDRLAPSPEVVAPGQEATPAFNCHEMSDLSCLGSCVCGARALHSHPLSTLATCHACARTCAVVRTRHYFVPAILWQQFAEHNGIEQQGGLS